MSVPWGLLKVKIISLIEAFIYVDTNTFGKTREENGRLSIRSSLLYESSLEEMVAKDGR